MLIIRKYLMGTTNLLILLAIVSIFQGCSVIGMKDDDIAKGPINSASFTKVVPFQSEQMGEAIENIEVIFEGKTIYIGNVLSEASRLYFPLLGTLKAMGAEVNCEKSKVEAKIGQVPVVFHIDEGKFECFGEEKPFIIKPIDYGDDYYLSIFDFCSSAGLLCSWNFPERKIILSTGFTPKIGDVSSGNRPALIRLEDIASLGADNTPDEMAKQRAIADYLYSQGVAFAAAVVPRYINPPRGIDNQPAEEYTFDGAEFVYTLDYFVGRGGVLGLHGYTHQNGNGKSLFDKEFGTGILDTKEETVRRIALAKQAASKLKLNIYFFEFPHYIQTIKQYQWVTGYFDCMYQWSGDHVKYVFSGLKKVKLVPTPLGYMDLDEDIDEKIAEIKSFPENKLMSIFVHPLVELSHIDINWSSLGTTVTYDENSPLHLIVKAMKEKGAHFVSVRDVQ